MSMFNISLFSTPPFSSDEESVEDTAYITSSRGMPSSSVRLVQSGSLLNPAVEPDWTDSELSEVLDSPKLYKIHNPQGEQMTYFYILNNFAFVLLQKISSVT